MSKHDDKPVYKVESASTSDLVARFQHKPEDFAASTQDYLADMHAHGWDLVAISNTPHGDRFVFRAVK